MWSWSIKKHFLVNIYGCRVHDGLSKMLSEQEHKVCACQEYWAEEIEISARSWREDHSVMECRKRGGACADELTF